MTAAGSLRRGKETLGDLDLLVIGTDHGRIADHFVRAPGITEILAKGEDKVSVRLKNGLRSMSACSKRNPTARLSSISQGQRSTTFCCATAPSAKAGS